MAKVLPMSGHSRREKRGTSPDLMHGSSASGRPTVDDSGSLENEVPEGLHNEEPLFLEVNSKNIHIDQVESSADLPNKGGDIVDTWQEKYLDKLNQDISEIKSSIQSSLQTFQTSLQNAEDRISKQVERAINDTKDDIKEIKKDIKEQTASLQSAEDRIRTDFKSQVKWVVGSGVATVTIAVATIIGIATMVVLVVQMLHK